MWARSPPAWAGRREGSFHGHEGEVVTLTRGCISPSPQPSPVKGEGEEPPSQSSPQMGEEGDHPARPPLWIPAPYRVRGRLCAGTTVGFPGFPRRTGEGPYRRERLSASNIAYRRADTWVRPYGWAREHPPHPIPLPRRGGRVSNQLFQLIAILATAKRPKDRLSRAVFVLIRVAQTQSCWQMARSMRALVPFEGDHYGRTWAHQLRNTPFRRISWSRWGFKPAPTEPRYAVSGRTRGVTLTPSTGSGQAPPLPLRERGEEPPSTLAIQL